jgi:hypothetical protein
MAVYIFKRTAKFLRMAGSRRETENGRDCVQQSDPYPAMKMIMFLLSAASAAPARRWEYKRRHEDYSVAAGRRFGVNNCR